MSVHGSARFAWLDDLIQGDLVVPHSDDDQELLRWSRGNLIGWIRLENEGFGQLRYRGDLHQLIVAGTGGGKFTTAIAPMLLAQDEDTGFVVVDPKGEIARLAGPFFERPFGKEPKVHLLDPWNQCETGQCSCLNVLDMIRPDNPNYVDDARALADAMIIPSGGENTHWDNTARNFLTAILLYVALDPEEEGKRDLIRVREIVTLPYQMPNAYRGPPRPTLIDFLHDLLDSDLADGAIKRAFTSLLNREDKERSGILSSIDRDTAWIDSPQMAKVLRGTSLDLRRAALEYWKCFIVIPPEFFVTHRAWVRLMVTAFAKAFKRWRPPQDLPQAERWRHIIIDEFANLGEMNFILNDVAVARGYDIKYHFLVQDLSQLRHLYGAGWESFINNSFQRFFAVGDMFTADYVSRMLGSATRESQSHSLGRSGGESQSVGTTTGYQSGTNIGSSGGSSTSTGGSLGTSMGYSVTTGWSDTQTRSQTQRQLLTPDEIRRLAPDAQLILMRGQRPVSSWRPPYWKAFTGLPMPYTLAQLWTTIGKEPKDRAEFDRWTEWRLGIQQMQPTVIPAPVPAPVLPAPSPSVPRYNGGRLVFAIIGLLPTVAALYGAWWLFWPSKPKPVDRAALHAADLRANAHAASIRYFGEGRTALHVVDEPHLQAYFICGSSAANYPETRPGAWLTMEDTGIDSRIWYWVRSLPQGNRPTTSSDERVLEILRPAPNTLIHFDVQTKLPAADDADRLGIALMEQKRQINVAALDVLKAVLACRNKR